MMIRAALFRSDVWRLDVGPILSADSGMQESISQGLKPGFVVVLNVRAEARTYLRGDSKGNSNGNGKSNRRSFDCDSRDEAARVFAQDGNFDGLARENKRRMGWQEKRAMARPTAFSG